MKKTDNEYPNRAQWFSAEMLVAYQFARHGYVISVPLAPCPYDLLVDNGETIYRIQVKRAKFKPQRMRKLGKGDRDHYHVDLTKRRHNRPSGEKIVRVQSRAYDYLAAVCEPNLVYVIPVKDLVALNDKRLLRAIMIKPPIEGRADSIKAGSRWAKYRNQTKLG